MRSELFGGKEEEIGREEGAFIQRRIFSLRLYGSLIVLWG